MPAEIKASRIKPFEVELFPPEILLTIVYAEEEDEAREIERLLRIVLEEYGCDTRTPIYRQEIRGSFSIQNLFPWKKSSSNKDTLEKALTDALHDEQDQRKRADQKNSAAHSLIKRLRAGASALIVGSVLIINSPESKTPPAAQESTVQTGRTPDGDVIFSVKLPREMGQVFKDIKNNQGFRAILDLYALLHLLKRKVDAKDDPSRAEN